MICQGIVINGSNRKRFVTNFLITKVLSTYSKGDFAIAKGMLDAITYHYPTAKISILCRNARVGKNSFQNTVMFIVSY